MSAPGTTTTQNPSKETPYQVLPAITRVGASTTTDDPGAGVLVVVVASDLIMTTTMTRRTLVVNTQGTMSDDEHITTGIMIEMLRVSTTTTTTYQRTQNAPTEIQTTSGTQTNAATEAGAVAEVGDAVVGAVGVEVDTTKTTDPGTISRTNNLANEAKTRT